jgi:hypothetical protein
MNYKQCLQQWTQCFVDNREIFKKIIEQVDVLIQLWTNATLNDEKRLSFFVTHMVTRCFQQGKNNVSFLSLIKNVLFCYETFLRITESFKIHRRRKQTPVAL